MKKGKILLSIIAVMAIAGGVLASKVKSPHVYYKPAAPGQPCTMPVTLIYTTTGTGGTIIECYSTAPTTATCCSVRVTDVN